MTRATMYATIRKLGMTVRERDGEIRVAFPGRDSEASAYYTNDRADAVSTACDMARRAARAPMPLDTRIVPLGEPSNPVAFVVDDATGSVAMNYGDGSSRVVAYPTSAQVDEMIATLSAFAVYLRRVEL